MKTVSGGIQKIIKTHFVILLATIFMTACGGDGGSSSGGGATAGGTIYTGTYVGPGKLTMSGGGGSATEPFVITVVIRGDGSVVLDPQTAQPGSGKVEGNTLSGSYSAEIANSPGISCSGRIDITGTIRNTGGRGSESRVIDGRVGPSKLTCNNVSLSATGSFTATRSGSLKQGVDPIGTGLVRGAKRALEQ